MESCGYFTAYSSFGLIALNIATHDGIILVATSR